MRLRHAKTLITGKPGVGKTIAFNRTPSIGCNLLPLEPRERSRPPIMGRAGNSRARSTAIMAASTASSVLGSARFTSSGRQKRDHHNSPIGGLNSQGQPVYSIHSLLSG